MVKELDNFRAKYPDYNDLDDVKLAGMLATKFPEAYGDLPNKVKPIEQNKPLSQQAQELGTADDAFASKTMSGNIVPNKNDIASDVMTTVKNISNPVSVAETAANMATSVYGVPASGLAGLLSLPFGLDAANNVLNKTKKALVYEPQTEGGKQLTDTVNYPLKKIDEGASFVGDKISDAGYPNLAATAKTAILAAPVLAGGKAALSKASSGKPFFIKDVAEIDSDISLAVNHGIKKGIRPSSMNQETSSQFSKYLKNAKIAVQEIINNKDNLSLRDETGQTVKGAIPKNLDQFSQAIEQTKRKVFEEYDTLAREANDQGAFVDLNKIPKDLEPIFKSKALQKFSPETIAYASERVNALTQEPIISILDSQDSVQILNQSLENFYKDPTPANKGRAMVDAAIANGMRKEMNSVIENTTGGQYKDLKLKYGALKTIESDVTKRFIVDSRKNEKGLLDFSDIFTGHQIVKALATKDPAGIAASGAAKLIKERMKSLNDPNKKIKKMFENVEKLNSEKPIE